MKRYFHTQTNFRWWMGFIKHIDMTEAVLLRKYFVGRVYNDAIKF